MSRTLAQLRTLQTEFMAMDLDNSSSEAPTSAQQLLQLNFALRKISRRMFLVDSLLTFTPVASTPIQNLRTACNKRVVQPLLVTINGIMLREAAGREYGLWSWAELMRYHPTWQTGDDGTPTLACYKGNSELILYQQPSAAVVSAAENFMVAQVLAADLSADGDVPAIPEECHEAVAYLAAVFAAKPTATEQEQWQRLGEFNRSWLEDVDEVARHNRDALQSWGSTQGYNVPDVMVL